jgi:predicted nucleotidyltransferase
MNELDCILDAIKGEPRGPAKDDPNWIPSPLDPKDIEDHGSEILIVGDVHGNHELLSRLIRVLQPKMVLQCGDFGYFPRLEYIPPEGSPTVYPFKLEGRLETGGVPVHWCDGNHEDHETLAKLRVGQAGAHEVAPNCFYQDRGSTLTLPDGRTALFSGGAESWDRAWRTEGRDWFAQELLTVADLARFPNCQVDVVISHTAPALIEVGHFDNRAHRAKQDDPSRPVLDEVFFRYRPRHWYFGHWHEARHDIKLQTKFLALDKLERGYGCWTWLPKTMPVLLRSERDAVLHKLAKVCDEAEVVVQAHVTGSYARGEATSASNLDVVIELEPEALKVEYDMIFERVKKEVGKSINEQIQAGMFPLSVRISQELVANDDPRLPPVEDNELVYRRPLSQLMLDEAELPYTIGGKRGLPVTELLKRLGRQMKNIRLMRQQVGMRDVLLPALKEAQRVLERGGNISLATFVALLKAYAVSPWLETLGRVARRYERTHGEWDSSRFDHNRPNRLRALRRRRRTIVK